MIEESFEKNEREKIRECKRKKEGRRDEVNRIKKKEGYMKESKINMIYS